MTLVFAAHRKPRTLDRIAHRRQKMVANIDQQLALLDLHRQGQTTKNVWFWLGEADRYYLSIRYGRTEIELDKGMFSIECTDLDAVGAALKEVRLLVLKGQLDGSLNKASDTLRAKFKST